MIVSNEKKFIFIHIPKTGGTSITHCLKPYASYNVFGEYTHKGKKFLHKDLRKHSRSTLIKKYVPKKKWNSYFKFCFVRNPWDLFVSLYTWLKPRSKTLQKKTFNQFITNFCLHPDKAVLMGGGQYPFLHTGNVCDVNFIGKFENYEKDVAYISKKLGIATALPHINKTNHKNYRSYYTKKTKSMLYEVCKKDIETFGYTF